MSRRMSPQRNDVNTLVYSHCVAPWWRLHATAGQIILTFVSPGRGLLPTGPTARLLGNARHRARPIRRPGEGEQEHTEETQAPLSSWRTLRALPQPAAPRRGGGGGWRRTLHPSTHAVPPQGGAGVVLLAHHQEAAEGPDCAAPQHTQYEDRTNQ